LTQEEEKYEFIAPREEGIEAADDTTALPKRKRIRPLVVTLIVLVVAVVVLYLYFGSGSASAATVNGKPISESAVTERCNIFRAQNSSFASDAGWAKALLNSKLTPETLREEVIRGMASDMLVQNEAKAAGITVNEQKVDAMFNQLKQSAGGSQGAWKKLLLTYAAANDTELRAYLAQQDLNSQLMAKIAPLPVNSSSEEQAAQYTKYQEYLQGLLSKADIKINPMPKDVPYNVDLGLLQTD